MLNTMQDHCAKGELDKALDLLKWYPKHGKNTPKPIFNSVIDLCRREKSIEGFQLVIAQADEERSSSASSAWNGLISILVESNELQTAREAYVKMEDSGVKVRQSSLTALLTTAIQTRDRAFTSLLLKSCMQHDVFPNGDDILLKVLKLCEGGSDELFDNLMAVYRTAERSIEPAMAQAITEKFRNCRDEYSVETTTVNYDGLCRGCGQQLENGHLSAAEVEELLCHVNHILYAEANTFLDNRLFLREQALLRNLIAEVGPITAVVDGLNAAHVKTQKIFSYNQLLRVTSNVLEAFGSPVLVIARDHLGRQLDRFLLERLKKDGLHFFFTQNQGPHAYYCFYGCLTSSPETLFFSDDKLTHMRTGLPKCALKLFARWQNTRQIAIRSNGRLMFPYRKPPTYAHAVQRCVATGNWHLPLADPSPHQHTWLCLQRKQQVEQQP